MATWRKHFKLADSSGTMSPISGGSQVNGNIAFKNYQSLLPDIYSGHPNRVERYNQYETMDMDSEVNACLDIIAEFSTQINPDNMTAFDLEYQEKPTDNEVKILTQQLKQWVKLQQFETRIFKIFRNSIKYGDQVFVRDPETYKLFWIEPNKLSRIIVNESVGKEPEQYIVKDINPNLENLSVAAKSTSDMEHNSSGGSFSAPNSYTVPDVPAGNSGRFTMGLTESAIDAEHVMHLSLSEGLDYHWPFGQSILEQIYKVYKQKELLEDAILIYRIQRAPERRLFYIDTCNMPSHLAMGFVERIKNEIHQRRIPSQNGSGQNMLDASYNPISQNEDYFFPVGADGRSSKVDVLPGGQNLSEIDDLRLWNNKMARGLKVPSSYLPSGPSDGADSSTFNNGAMGTALIQEHRFNQYCLRLQRTLIQNLNTEFKLFLKWRGFNIDSKLFDIRFNEPQNFSSSRQVELDNMRMGNFASLIDIPFMSKRFALKRFLGLSEAEMLENEEMWREENTDKTEGDDDGMTGDNLRSVGVSPGDMDTDLAGFDDMEGEDDFENLDGDEIDDLGMEDSE